MAANKKIFNVLILHVGYKLIDNIDEYDHTEHVLPFYPGDIVPVYGAMSRNTLYTSMSARPNIEMTFGELAYEETVLANFNHVSGGIISRHYISSYTCYAIACEPDGTPKILDEDKISIDLIKDVIEESKKELARRFGNG